MQAKGSRGQVHVHVQHSSHFLLKKTLYSMLHCAHDIAYFFFSHKCRCSWCIASKIPSLVFCKYCRARKHSIFVTVLCTVVIACSKLALYTPSQTLPQLAWTIMSASLQLIWWQRQEDWSNLTSPSLIMTCLRQQRALKFQVVLLGISTSPFPCQKCNGKRQPK